MITMKSSCYTIVLQHAVLIEKEGKQQTSRERGWTGCQARDRAEYLLELADVPLPSTLSRARATPSPPFLLYHHDHDLLWAPYEHHFMLRFAVSY